MFFDSTNSTNSTLEVKAIDRAKNITFYLYNPLDEFVMQVNDVNQPIHLVQVKEGVYRLIALSESTQLQPATCFVVH